jgi:hypothetical protein
MKQGAPLLLTWNSENWAPEIETAARKVSEDCGTVEGEVNVGNHTTLYRWG